MRLFHELVFDYFFEAATGFGGLANPVHWDPVMGGVESLRFMFVSDHVAGTAPTLTVLILERPELTEVFSNNGSVLNEVLTVNQTNVHTFSVTPDDGWMPDSYSFRLYVAFNGGDSPKARVRAWVTGRGRA